ncbi:MAG: hypothetical protein O3B72_08760 [Proteobacteria bacterium]|nr:hypothetical protein [Pseudomonadota bacterium]
MAASVDVTIERAEIVHTLPGIWETGDLRRLLELVEFDDLDGLSDSDLHEVALMVLQDLGHQEAGEAVLETIFGKEMGKGVRQNLVDDLQDEEPWQDFSNVRQQRGIFAAVVLMHQAFPNRYLNPDAKRVALTLSMDAETLSNAALLRLLALGMEPTDVLRRLYDTDLASGPFPDADHLIWSRESPAPREIVLISSRQWLGALARGMSFRGKV